MSSVADLVSQTRSLYLLEEPQPAAASTNAPGRGNSPLASLPYDILSHDLIPQFTAPVVLLEPSQPTLQVSPSALSLRNLASTSKYFRSLVSGQYKSYLLHQYPAVHAKVIQQASVNGTSLDNVDWAAKVVAAERLNSAWTQRRLYISSLDFIDKVADKEPTVNRSAGRNWRERRRPAPTAPDYSPCLDLYETFSGTEILTVGQGAQFSVRNGANNSWKIAVRDGMVAGGDDILNVHIVDEDTVIATRSSSMEVVTNVANDSEELKISHITTLPSAVTKPSTDGISSSSIDRSSTGEVRNIAVTTTKSDVHNLQIFGVEKSDSSVTISSSYKSESVIPSKPWVSAFLNSTTIAVGHRAGVSVYNLTPNGLSEPTDISQPSSSYTHDLGVHSMTALAAPFSPSIFASGWSDGLTRLFDIRSNRYVATYADTVSAEPVPVFSLLHTSPMSNNLIVGSSQHNALQIHDLRYSATALNVQGSNGPLRVRHIGTEDANMDPWLSDGCLLFVGRVTSLAARRAEQQNRNWHRGQGSSAVYSLCGTTGGSKVYVGMENRVITLDFKNGSDRTQARAAKQKPACVAMYWFDPNKGTHWNDNTESCWNGNSWVCGQGKPPWKGLPQNI